jgi:hypothetical protein
MSEDKREIHYYYAASGSIDYGLFGSTYLIHSQGTRNTNRKCLTLEDGTDTSSRVFGKPNCVTNQKSYSFLPFHRAYCHIHFTKKPTHAPISTLLYSH